MSKLCRGQVVEWQLCMLFSYIRMPKLCGEVEGVMTAYPGCLTTK
jgi:hypothetical protein